MIRRRALLPAVALLVGACGSAYVTPKPLPITPLVTPTPTDPPAGPVSPLRWTSCHGDFQCATLSVPLNYADPTATKISIALIRQPATDPKQRLGSILVNPGGPGGSGLEFLEEGGLPWGTLAQRYDIVSFDPRGVGSSTAVHCATTAQMTNFIAANPNPTTPAQIASEVALSRSFANGCEQMSASLLPYVGTANAARDMDRIRIGLGEAKLNYFGFSYGSYLGTAYATLFPKNVGLMVLDGDINPELSQVQIATDQSEGFQVNLDAMLSACAANSACPMYNNGNPHAELETLLARINAHPMKVGNRLLTNGQAFLGVLTPLYSPSYWSIAETAINEAYEGNGLLMLDLADSYDDRQPNGTYSNELDANVAINCDDGPAPPSLATMEKLAAQLDKVAPDFGISGAYGSLTCAYWPFPPIGRITPNDTGAPTILLIGGTHDPATPYAWAVALHHELAGSVLVTRDGYGHVSFDKSACVRGIVDNYFISGSVPAPNTVCQSDPIS